MAGVPQEFYCTKSGGGCGGYILFPLNMKLNGVVEVKCPNCGHVHQRMLKDGVLEEQGRHIENPSQVISPTLPAWSKVARHPESAKGVGKWDRERNAVKVGREYLDDLWLERHGGKACP